MLFLLAVEEKFLFQGKVSRIVRNVWSQRNSSAKICWRRRNSRSNRANNFVKCTISLFELAISYKKLKNKFNF